MSRKPPSPPEDAALWDQVAKTVAPLAPRRPEPPPSPAKSKAPVAKTAAAGPVMPPLAAEKRGAPKPPALSPLDRRTRGRLARGAVAIDRRIDLHGMTQAAAHRRLLSFLDRAQDEGARMVLVITGKGRASESGYGADERGVLKRIVPIWLSAPELRAIVIGFETAAPTHGGEGALYVRIRKARG
jgi:DNA-nicking Smr family endonuclease